MSEASSADAEEVRSILKGYKAASEIRNATERIAAYTSLVTRCEAVKPRLDGTLQGRQVTTVTSWLARHNCTWDASGYHSGMCSH